MIETEAIGAGLPWLTADLAGTGGAIKRFDEDFIVEELPLYEACGEGTHCYVTIEKRGLTTPAAVRMFAGALDRRAQDVGYAGLKDAHGVTRQRLSIEHVDPAAIEALTLNRISILSVARHTNKLKLGHLSGNRFEIRIREAGESTFGRAESILKVLASRGVPDYFGPQRFGVRGDNAAIGRAVLREDFDEAMDLMLGRPGARDQGDALRARELYEAGDLAAAGEAWPRSMAGQRRVCRTLLKFGGDGRKGWRSVDHSLRKLYVSAVQSELFNKVLAHRIDGIDRMMEGDVAWKHRNGACFQVEEITVDQERCDAFEISPTGPLFGRRMKQPAGEPGRLEEEVLSASGLARDQVVAKDGSKLDGARRPLRVPLGEPQLEEGEDERGGFLCVKFSLPPGAYATSVVREICKTER